MGCGVSVLRHVSFVSLKENDYIESYFDNGEDFAADSDDNMDGEATYWGHGTQTGVIILVYYLK